MEKDGGEIPERENMAVWSIFDKKCYFFYVPFKKQF